MLETFLPGFDPLQIALLCFTALAAGLARGFSGFGAALIFVPVASAIVGPQLAAVLLLIVDAVGGLGMIPDAWAKAERRDVAIMSVGALVGIPIGTAVLRYADPIALRWGIVVLVFAMLALLASGWRFHGRPKPQIAIPVGALAGFCSGAAQAGGPPVVAYWLGGAIGHRTARANIVLYFALSSCISIASYLAGGLFRLDALKLALIVGPVYALAIYGGAQLFGRADDRFFRRVCLCLIGVAAILGMPIWR